MTARITIQDSAANRIWRCDEGDARVCLHGVEADISKRFNDIGIELTGRGQRAWAGKCGVDIQVITRGADGAVFGHEGDVVPIHIDQRISGNTLVDIQNRCRCL